MNKWLVGGVAAGALLVGGSLKKIHDVVQKEKAEAPKPVETQIVKENITVSQVLINRKAIINWLEASGVEGLPKNDKLTICSAYGCAHKSKFRVTATMYNDVKTILDSSTDAETERENLKKAVDYLKSESGKATGTDGDKPGDPFMGNGNPGQMSEFDETVNTVQYLYLLADKGYIRFHHLEAPSTAEYFIGTTNNIVDKDTGKTYSVGYDKEGKAAIVSLK